MEKDGDDSVAVPEALSPMPVPRSFAKNGALQMLSIDGGVGEGGGQILRSCTSLAVLLNMPLSITGIRKNRAKPGARQLAR